MAKITPNLVPVLLAATLSGCAVVAVADAAVSVGAAAGAAAVSVGATAVSVGAKVVGAAVDVVIPDDDDKQLSGADSQEGR